MKRKSLEKLLLVAGLSLLLSACTTGAESNSNGNSNKKEIEVQNSNSDDQKSKKDNPLEILNDLAKKSESTNEIYVTGDIKIGENETVKPGIFDLEVTGGSGNITGSRANINGLFINWVAGAADTDNDYPSKIRIILFEGDTLEFRDISKIKLTAIPENVDKKNELGIGEFVVGRDIAPGNYKLSTNMTMNPEFDNLGWSVDIYNDDNGSERRQSYNPGNTDVVISLKDGEVISTSFDNTDHGTSSDEAKLILTEFKQ